MGRLASRRHALQPFARRHAAGPPCLLSRSIEASPARTSPGGERAGVFSDPNASQFGAWRPGACVHNRYCVGFACRTTPRTVLKTRLIPGRLPAALRAWPPARCICDRARFRSSIKYFDANKAQLPTFVVPIRRSHRDRAAPAPFKSLGCSRTGLAAQEYDSVQTQPSSSAYGGATRSLRTRTYDDVGPGAENEELSHGNPHWWVANVGCGPNSIRPPYAFSGDAPPGKPRWGKAHKDYRGGISSAPRQFPGGQEMPVFRLRVRAATRA